MSFGGYVALRAIQKSENLFCGLILVGAVYDIEDFAKSRTETWDSLPYSFYFGKLKDFLLTLITKKSGIDIEKLNIPILIFHGKKDSRVPEHQPLKFIEECKRYDKRYFYYNDFNTHGVNSPDEQFVCNSKMVDFINSMEL